MGFRRSSVDQEHGRAAEALSGDEVLKCWLEAVDDEFEVDEPRRRKPRRQNPSPRSRPLSARDIPAPPQ